MVLIILIDQLPFQISILGVHQYSDLRELNAIALHFLYSYFCSLVKLAIHIFTIYILALSLAPCGDGGNGIVEITKQFFGVEHQHISDHDQHSNDILMTVEMIPVPSFVFVVVVQWR